MVPRWYGHPSCANSCPRRRRQRALSPFSIHGSPAVAVIVVITTIATSDGSDLMNVGDDDDGESLSTLLALARTAQKMPPVTQHTFPDHDLQSIRA